MLDTQYPNDRDKLVFGFTYLFEIIYPENRIVVNYGDQRRLVLLSAFADNWEVKTNDFRIEWPDRAEVYSFPGFTSVINNQKDNKEGYVLRFESGLRLKIKFDEYVRLHRILTNITAKSIWELLKNNESTEDLLEKVPDEFYRWFKATKLELENKFRKYKSYAENLVRLRTHQHPDESEKDFALWAKEQTHPHLLFSQKKGKDLAPQIWKMIKPEHEIPFKQEI